MKNSNLRSLTFAQVILIVLSAALLTAGILLGDNAAIFRKAVFICMECIGIG
jgi:hypothetical protein